MSSYSPAVQSAKYCLQCDGIMDAKTVSCPHCGTLQTRSEPGISDKRIFPAAILCFMLGWFGAHRFYVGKRTSAIVQLCTLGGLGLWALADLVVIVFGGFTDGDGNRIVEWT